MASKGKWRKLQQSDILNLAIFARKVYPGFNEVSHKFVVKIFRKYLKSTLVYCEKGKIKGFAVYQDWPDACNFILIYLPYSKTQNVKVILSGRHLLPQNKKIVWWDEEKMEGRGIWH